MHITLYYYIYFYSYIYFNNSLKRIFLKKFDSKGEKAFPRETVVHLRSGRIAKFVN